MKALLALTALLLGPLLTSASAQDVSKIFVADRRAELCKQSGDVRTVDTVRLAQAMVEQAQVPVALLDRANSAGLADGQVTVAELFKAMNEAVNKTKFFSKFKEFGQRAQDADKSLTQVTEALQSFLRDGKESEGYVVFKGGAPLPKNTLVRMESFFSDSPPVEIRCVTVAADTASAPAVPVAEADFNERFGGLVDQVQQRLRVRAKVPDLAITKPEKIKDLESAKVSFNHDAGDDQDTFKVKGVVGWDFGKLLGWNLLPYVKYEHTNLTPDSKTSPDVEVLGPGLLAHRGFTLGPSFTADVNVTAEATLDLAQRSRLFKLQAFVDPSYTIHLDNGSSVQFPGERLRFGRLRVRPNLTPMVDFVQVIERGSNKALKDARTFVGVGAEAGVKVRLVDTPLFEDILLRVKYWHLQLFGAHLANAHRLTTSLGYDITPNISLTFGYEDGHNRDTFQEERYYNLSLGFKY